MLKVILNAPHPITPFNEPARDLRIQNTPLWLHQRNVLAPYTTREVELNPGQRIPQERVEMVVYRDNLFFDEEYITTFMRLAQTQKRACRAAFSADDAAFKEHALPLASSYTPAGNLFLADLWYYPAGPVADVESLVIDLDAREMGYYHVPTYMADQSGDLTFQVPLRTLIAISSRTWSLGSSPVVRALKNVLTRISGSSSGSLLRLCTKGDNSWSAPQWLKSARIASLIRVRPFMVLPRSVITSISMPAR
jgi:hypothetical protein